MSDVELRAVVKTFPDPGAGETTVLHGIDIRAGSGQFVVLLGPSGCGKSTSLRIVAGLESATSGDVLIEGVRVNEVPAAKRHIAMVFQNYALYPHLTVLENIVFGLRVRKVPKAEREAKARDAAERVGLEAYLKRRPSQLSGGQRQRTALARALVSDAKVVLMDEPLSNLDARLRHQMRVELRELQRSLGLTVLYVTHDQVEAMTMADHVVVMRDGNVAQAASPVDLYTDPADAGVAAFIGSPPMNLLPGRLDEAGLRLAGDGAGLPIPTAVATHGLADGRLTVGVRPESLALTDDAAAPLAGTVRLSEILGAETLLTVDLAPGEQVVARLPGIVRVADGAHVRLAVAHDDVRYFDHTSGRRLAGADDDPAPLERTGNAR
ncbi:ABC transporter related [Beutenbergia cavernae DSM 12333]|uniref:ABC transporter related n=1 Tax=Beutenbergia cavernae (strain ATCC BAA-8 / DSM 12333 / CCUG 43141 / JCM 11478 / NBRC 16432 / NCIMB 13614 / HKI 0122) TaxID=471853 RepID=C5BYX5_BEUC1|nr:ATP-binding cassette domain-containing protein [Beutenbergia cavernae]ACQ81090.1 ABC transporter related [Beutenbergia cavernae DSM 12333]